MSLTGSKPDNLVEFRPGTRELYKDVVKKKTREGIHNNVVLREPSKTWVRRCRTSVGKKVPRDFKKPLPLSLVLEPDKNKEMGESFI